ncbi:MAG: hypothetical protein LBF89_12965, partial [Bacteroidales bacterium]|nr:hypothetical protein [Bacteroidales bacterium]
QPTDIPRSTDIPSSTDISSSTEISSLTGRCAFAFYRYFVFWVGGGKPRPYINLPIFRLLPIFRP